MSDTKKIALCMSGESRHSMTCFPYLYDSFNNNKKDEVGYEIDVFYHTWLPNERVISLWNPKAVLIESEDDAYQECLRKIKIPIDFFVGKQEGVHFYKKRIYTTQLMFYGIHSIINHVNNLTDCKYDYIIRCRPDILLYERIDLNQIINEIVNFGWDIIIPNKVMNYSPKGYQDQLAIGRAESMVIYANTFNHLTHLIQQNDRWHAEEFLFKHLKDNNIKVYQPDIYFQLCRESTITTNHDDTHPFGRESLSDN